MIRANCEKVEILIVLISVLPLLAQALRGRFQGKPAPEAGQA